MVTQDIFQNIRAYIKFLHQKVNITKWTHDFIRKSIQFIGNKLVDWWPNQIISSFIKGFLFLYKEH